MRPRCGILSEDKVFLEISAVGMRTSFVFSPPIVADSSEILSLFFNLKTEIIVFMSHYLKARYFVKIPALLDSLPENSINLFISQSVLQNAALGF